MRDPLIPIGELARRAGIKVSAVRYYEQQGLIPSQRSPGGSRLFARSTLRRISFILICQQLGYRLDDIRQVLGALPENRTPTRADWTRVARQIRADLNRQITALQRTRDTLDGCIGCGCLSLRRCTLYNPEDSAATQGAGARFLLDDAPPRGEP